MTIRPYGDYLLVKPHERKQVLRVDDGALSEYGEVVALGEGCNESIKIGDTIGFSVFGVEKLVIDEEKYYFIRQNAEFLLCVITD